MEHARHLGLMMGRTLIANSEEEMTLAFNLAIYTAKEGQSRAIDRYAKVAQLPPDSDERSMLDAICHAQFSIWRVARLYDTCGLVVNDVLRQAEAWLVDEGLELVQVACALPVGFATPIYLLSPAALSYPSVSRCSRKFQPASPPADIPNQSILATIHVLLSIARRLTLVSWMTLYSTDLSSASPKMATAQLSAHPERQPGGIHDCKAHRR